MSYCIRLGGTSEFVSKIDPTDPRCHPPGSVDFVEGWHHPDALTYGTFNEAKRASEEVWAIEGFHTTIEERI